MLIAHHAVGPAGTGPDAVWLQRINERRVDGVIRPSALLCGLVGNDARYTDSVSSQRLWH